MHSEPLVSIIIPTFNRAHLISETLDSVLAQTYTNWECIVVDDGSTDNTEYVVNIYMVRDKRIHFYNRPTYKNKGANACRNYGFELSKGAYLNWLDSDDLLVSSKLSEQVYALKSQNGLLCVSQAQLFQYKIKDLDTLWSKELVTTTAIDSLISQTTRWACGALLWDRSQAEKLEWNENLYGAQEWYYHIVQVLDLIPEKIVLLEVPLIHIRTGNTSITRQDNIVYRYSNYLLARITLLEILQKNNKLLFDRYFYFIYKFSIRYTKVLIDSNKFDNIKVYCKFLSQISLFVCLKFSFAVLIYKLFKTDYFLKKVVVKNNL